MRIISGKLKGRRFDLPKSFKARPTTDIAKEALFNILNNYYSGFEELKVLDLFSGSGSISYEFASRGCEDVTAIEYLSQHAAYIKLTLQHLGFEDQVHVHNKDFFRFAKQIGKQYDLIFADPPFDMPSIVDVPKVVFENNLLVENGLFIMEHGPHQDFSKEPNFTKLKRYGKVHFSIFDPEANAKNIG